MSADWPLYTHDAEILELILDTAHPPGSILETIDGDTDPNALWPWTEWGEAGTGTAGSLVTHKWIRAR